MKIVITKPDGAEETTVNVAKLEFDADVQAFSIVQEDGQGVSVPLVNVLKLEAS